MTRVLLLVLLATLALADGRADDESAPVVSPTPSDEDHAGERLVRALTRLEESIESMKRHVPAIVAPTPTLDLRPFAITTPVPRDKAPSGR